MLSSIDRDFFHMLEARQASTYSNCKRRKIGVAIPLSSGDTILGSNQSFPLCETCHRETCSAVHAEVNAICIALKHSLEIDITKLYIWAEVPCLQCLSFIKKFSSIDMIYCLSPESYKEDYPIIARRTEEISVRRSTARSLGISIIELDQQEIIEYELHQSTKAKLQSNQT